ncbi:stress-activated map kinase-interacting protein 1 [Leguminivora glycinivorella]|uniref:stress-activated map kinase-interacting protein 1 n=1 Tax=Leguminivora glycinivorella TaxID=1035111 RepID=UPI00200D9C34|nr:stress-activated map kinase-interacting protein 1 [Leguminivora glycinivorella]
MATLDNKIWLLKNIRDAFIATDDTGLCEIVMAGEDFSKIFQAKAADERIRLKDERLCRPSTSHGRDGMGNISEDEDQEIVTQFDAYPQMEDSEEDDLMSGSYIRYDDIGGHRQRSNTAQWLDKKEQALKKASKIKVIKWDDSSTELTEEQIADNFTKMEIRKPKQKSMLTELLEKCPDLPHMQYLEYAKFDGTAQLGLQTKMFKIFMKISEKYHNYPLVVCVIATARIKDLIGFTCYKYSIEHPDISLGNINEYGLCIAEDDGDVDLAFPCLDALEPCSKFGFTCLGLIELNKRGDDNITSSLPDHATSFQGFMFPKVNDSGQSHQNPSRHNTGGSATSEAVKNALEAVNEGLKKADNDLDKLHSHAMATSAPQYKAYRVHMLRRVRANTLIQLGVSIDRVEVEPLANSKHTHWLKPKYFMHSIDSIAWCQIMEAKGNKCVFRIVYTDEQKQSTFDRSTSFFHSNTNYKYHDFECDHQTAKEIVEKVNTILEFRNSPCRREYKTAKEKKQQTRRSFHSKHLTSS